MTTRGLNSQPCDGYRVLILGVGLLKSPYSFGHAMARSERRVVLRVLPGVVPDLEFLRAAKGTTAALLDL